MPVSPRLLNPTKVVFQQTIRGETRIDPVRRTPLNVIARSEKWEIDAQVVWAMNTSDNSVEVSKAGPDQTQMGYVIVREKDLKALGKTVKYGDVITKVEDLDVKLFVLRVQPGSHYGGKYTLTKIIFEDRTSKEAG